MHENRASRKRDHDTAIKQFEGPGRVDKTVKRRKLEPSSSNFLGSVQRRNAEQHTRHSERRHLWTIVRPRSYEDEIAVQEKIRDEKERASDAASRKRKHKDDGQAEDAPSAKRVCTGQQETNEKTSVLRPVSWNPFPLPWDPFHRRTKPAGQFSIPGLFPVASLSPTKDIDPKAYNKYVNCRQRNARIRPPQILWCHRRDGQKFILDHIVRPPGFSVRRDRPLIWSAQENFREINALFF